MSKPIDITGEKYNRLIAIRRGERLRHWVFRCECGTEKEQYMPGVRFGSIKSCGCLNSENIDARNRTHGLSRHPLYHCWNGMRARCAQKDNRLYGARGIKVCERWENFANFLEDMGPRPPGTSLDRKDVNGDYEPDNCRWATPTEQNENTRRNVYLELDGQRLTISQWARRLGVQRKTLNRRYASGWTAEQIIRTPIGARR